MALPVTGSFTFLLLHFTSSTYVASSSAGLTQLIKQLVYHYESLVESPGSVPVRTRAVQWAADQGSSPSRTPHSSSCSHLSNDTNGAPFTQQTHRVEVKQQANTCCNSSVFGQMSLAASCPCESLAKRQFHTALGLTCSQLPSWGTTYCAAHRAGRTRSQPAALALYLAQEVPSSP